MVTCVIVLRTLFHVFHVLLQLSFRTRDKYIEHHLPFYEIPYPFKLLFQWKPIHLIFFWKKQFITIWNTSIKCWIPKYIQHLIYKMLYLMYQIKEQKKLNLPTPHILKLPSYCHICPREFSHKGRGFLSNKIKLGILFMSTFSEIEQNHH